MLNTVVVSSLHCKKHAHVLNLTLPDLLGGGWGGEGGGKRGSREPKCLINQNPYNSQAGYQQSYMPIVVHADLLHNDIGNSWQS